MAYSPQARLYAKYVAPGTLIFHHLACGAENEPSCVRACVRMRGSPVGGDGADGGHGDGGCRVSNLHVLRRVGEMLGVLRRRVLRPVGGSVADDHHDGTVGVDPLGSAEEIDAVIGDQVREVVLVRRERKRG